MITTFVILGVTIVLFVWGRWSPDLVALLSLLALALSGVIDTRDALAGFGNATVVMIAALFVVGEGRSRTGVTGWGGKKLLDAARGSKIRLLVVAMVGTALLSAFISNTGRVQRCCSTHFLSKTLEKVKTEMSLQVLAYNMKRRINIVGVKPLMQAITA